MISPQKKWLLIASFLLVSGGFIFKFWILSALGVLLAAFGGSLIGAVCMGLLLDLAYGAPTGFVQYLYFPFAIMAIVAGIGRWFAFKYMLQFRAQERL